MIDVLFLVGAVALIYFTYLDFMKGEIPDELSIAFLFLAVVFSLINHQFFLNIILMGLFFGVCYILWMRDVFGGADTKILPSIIPFLGLTGFGESLSGLMVFFFLFAIIGGVYGLLAKLIVRRKEVPFLPAITLTYLAFLIFYKHLLF